MTIPLVDPITVGFDPARLHRLYTFLAAATTDGRLPGAAIQLGRVGRFLWNTLLLKNGAKLRCLSLPAQRKLRLVDRNYY